MKSLLSSVVIDYIIILKTKPIVRKELCEVFSNLQRECVMEIFILLNKNL